MPLLAALTHAELIALEGKILDDLHEVNAELDQLERFPRPARDLAYGPGVLQGVEGVRNDMVDLLGEAAIALAVCSC